jgi:hypothetical protein
MHCSRRAAQSGRVVARHADAGRRIFPRVAISRSVLWAELARAQTARKEVIGIEAPKT